MGGIARIPAMIAIASLMRSAGSTSETNASESAAAEAPSPQTAYVHRPVSEVRFRSQKLERFLKQKLA